VITPRKDTEVTLMPIVVLAALYLYTEVTLMSNVVSLPWEGRNAMGQVLGSKVVNQVLAIRLVQ